MLMCLTSQVPNLYPKDEIVPLLDMIRTRAKKAGKDGSIAELYMYFIELCRTNLHMVMCMSPFGDNFRTRLRMFPSLVNCCTIDWFSEWPEEALRSVATNFVASIDIDESLQESVRDMCMLFHQHAATLAVTFLQEAQRFIYVTPTSYLELLATYKDLLHKKRKEIDSIRTRYKVRFTFPAQVPMDSIMSIHHLFEGEAEESYYADGVGKTVFCGITSDCHEGVTCCITTNSDQNC
jgi:dynein heavy chain